MMSSTIFGNDRQSNLMVPKKVRGIFGEVRALLILNCQLTLVSPFFFVYNMLLRLLAITAALFLITFSNALSYDTSASHHLARHQHIAARHPAVKRASVSTRCKKRNSTPAAAPSSTSHPNTPTAPPPSSSQAPPSSGSGKGKVGIAWPNGNAPYLKNFITEKVSVFVDFFFSSSSSPYFFYSSIYNWSPDIPQDTYGLEFIPMLWGQNQIAHFKDVVKGGYANFVLGFNE